MHLDKKTKIVSTIGPVTESLENMKAIIEAGVNVIRLNFSHGSHDEHRKRVENARKVSKMLNKPVAVLQDLCGPKIRIGDFSTESVTLKEGERFTLTTKKITGDVKKVYINYENLHNEIKSKSIIFLNDGKIKLVVEKIEGKDIHCKILAGGEIKGRRGVNLPGAYLKIGALTDKDKEDVKFGIENDVDFIALSFVRTAKDIIDLRKLIGKNTGIEIIAKIETAEAIEHLDSIIKEADGVMVARGDLAVEVPAEEVPILQKEIIKKCNMAGKPVITATQMLSSMVHTAVPTRAEINDVANAILDGTDAVMLSEETTIGKYALETVRCMVRIAKNTEKYIPYENILENHHLALKDITGAVGYSIVNAAHDLNAKAIVVLTISGYTARAIAKYRPNRHILVLTPNKKTYNKLALSFNCYAVCVDMFEGVSNTIDIAKQKAVELRFLEKGDIIVIAAGIPFSKTGNTNTLLIQQI